MEVFGDRLGSCTMFMNAKDGILIQGQSGGLGAVHRLVDLETEIEVLSSQNFSPADISQYTFSPEELYKELLQNRIRTGAVEIRILHFIRYTSKCWSCVLHTRCWTSSQMAECLGVNRRHPKSRSRKSRVRTLHNESDSGNPDSKETPI